MQCISDGAILKINKNVYLFKLILFVLNNLSKTPGGNEISIRKEVSKSDLIEVHPKYKLIKNDSLN